MCGGDAEVYEYGIESAYLCIFLHLISNTAFCTFVVVVVVAYVVVVVYVVISVAVFLLEDIRHFKAYQ